MTLIMFIVFNIIIIIIISSKRRCGITLQCVSISQICFYIHESKSVFPHTSPSSNIVLDITTTDSNDTEIKIL
jgi:cytochrome bd-type quinol oxidase subunit 2